MITKDSLGSDLQAGHLERPTEVTSPKEVVALRLAWEQATGDTGDTEKREPGLGKVGKRWVKGGKVGKW
jgi:hypothetical protein